MGASSPLGTIKFFVDDDGFEENFLSTLLGVDDCKPMLDLDAISQRPIGVPLDVVGVVFFMQLDKFVSLQNFTKRIVCFFLTQV